MRDLHKVQNPDPERTTDDRRRTTDCGKEAILVLNGDGTEILLVDQGEFRGESLICLTEDGETRGFYFDRIDKLTLDAIFVGEAK